MRLDTLSQSLTGAVACIDTHTRGPCRTYAGHTQGKSSTGCVHSGALPHEACEKVVASSNSGAEAHPCLARDVTSSVQPPCPRSLNHGLLNALHIPPWPNLEVPDVQNWVHCQLTGPVIRHFAATRHVVDPCPQVLELHSKNFT
jgi:hypothetical protein